MSTSGSTLPTTRPCPRMPENPHRPRSAEICIIGSGLIGLSIAREIAGRGGQVVVVGRGRPEESSSWAAAGILPHSPIPADPAASPNEALTAFSDQLHRDWALQLLEETGVDNQLRRRGGLHLAADPVGLARLNDEARSLAARGIGSTFLDPQSLLALEPTLAGAVTSGDVIAGLHLPNEMLIDPQQHLEAVRRSCLIRGVTLVEDDHVVHMDRSGDRINAIRTAGGRSIAAASFVIAAGAWSRDVSTLLGFSIDTRPIRGQILLLRPLAETPQSIINIDLDYLLTRGDGNVLVGSTLEDVGFTTSTTPEVVDRLRDLAGRLIPHLRNASVEKVWAGLRPGSPDGLPFIGPLPGLVNVFVAAGHFRAGIHQAPGTAVVVTDLLEHKKPALPIRAFELPRSIDRGAAGGIDAYLAAASRGWK